jgi:hypothetical protein
VSDEAPPGALKNASEGPISLESISARLPPEGQAWLNGLNPFCRRAVEHDLRNAGPDLFVEYWKSLRDTLEKLEREFGPSSGNRLVIAYLPRLLLVALDPDHPHKFSVYFVGAAKK